MRPLALVIFSAALLASAPRAAGAQGRAPGRVADDLVRARALDQQGAKAYADGRYNDAIRYFEEAHRLGGPPFELWNIAKCHAKLDQPEQAAEMLERYLATPTLPAEDREEATQQLEALRSRPSTVTIASTPTGAAVAVDGRAPDGASRTPTTFTVPPGPHTVTLTLPSYAPYTQQLDVRYGRAVILDVRMAKDRRPQPPENPYGEGGEEEVRRLALRADLGVMLPRYGSVGGAAHPAFSASGMYRFADVGATLLSAGALLHVTSDSWDNTVGAPSSVPPCGTLKNPRSATAFSFFAMGAAGWEVIPRLRVHALGGLGLAAYSVDDLGGDLFVPTCAASPGVRPAMVVGGRLDFTLTPLIRLSALPLLLQLQPSFVGTRDATSGTWLRATMAVGIGVDL